jgi:hypothetical protein
MVVDHSCGGIRIVKRLLKKVQINRIKIENQGQRTTPHP